MAIARIIHLQWQWQWKEAMVTKAKVRQQMVAMMASREIEVPGVPACPLEDDWEIPDTRQGRATLFQIFSQK